MLLITVVLVFDERTGSPGPGAGGTSGGNAVQNGGVVEEQRTYGGAADDSAGDESAQRLDALLTESIAGRKYLLRAIDAALACDKSAAIADMERASDARAALRDKAGGTDLAALPGGDHLKSALVDFLQASYEADEAYLRWTRGAQGCPSTRAARFEAVTSANSRARARKTEFLDAWNPVAQRYGLPARDVRSI